jgi:hypothetical protein
MAEQHEDQNQPEQTPIWQRFIGVAVLVALAAAAVLAVAQIYPHKLPINKNPSFTDNIFDSRVVILLIRVALIFAAGYVVISVVGLIVGRRCSPSWVRPRHRSPSHGWSGVLTP